MNLIRNKATILREIETNTFKMLTNATENLHFLICIFVTGVIRKHTHSTRQDLHTKTLHRFHTNLNNNKIETHYGPTVRRRLGAASRIKISESLISSHT